MGAVFLTLLHMSLAAGVLVIAVVLLRLLLKRAPKAIHCALWALVALRLLLPFSVESPFSLIPEEVAQGEILSEWRGAYRGTTMMIFDEMEGYDAAVAAGREEYYAGEPGHYYVVTGEDGISAPNTVETEVFPILGWVWLTGCAVMLLYAAVSFFRIRKQVQLSLPLRENIWRCESVDSPFILGFFRPKIYLPFHMDEGQMRHVIAHEEAHLHRRDHWWKPLGFLLLAVYWFNPLLWVAYILLCRDIELACDERVIRNMNPQEKKAYSEALLSCSLPRRMVAACPLAFGEVGVKKRIASVLHYKKPAFWVLVVAIVACVVVAVCFLTNPPKDTTTAESISSAPEDIFSRVDTSSPAEMLAYLCQADLWEDAIKEKPEISIVGNFDTTAMFSHTPSDSDALDIAMARRAYLLMRLYPRRVSYVLWSYPDENGSIVNRELNSDEMSAIVSLSSHTEVIVTPDSAKRLEQQLGFLGALDEKLFLRFSEAETSVYTTLLNSEKLTDTLLAKAINQAILDHNKPTTPDGLYHCASFAVLSMEEISGTPTSDSAQPKTQVTVYGHALHQAFGFSGHTFRTAQASHIPVALTFTLQDGNYILAEYWEPRSGNFYAEDIQNKFPDEIEEDALNNQKYLLSQTQHCYEQAIQYGGVDAFYAVEYLFDVISSSPTTASRPVDYIDAHPAEYLELTYYGDYTLRYILAEFLKGGQTGLKGHLMRTVLDELAPEVQLRLHTETGQEYFEAWKDSALRVAQHHDTPWLEENLPAVYLLIQVINSSSPIIPADTPALPDAIELDAEVQQAACNGILASLRTGWWTSQDLNPAKEAAAFTCFHHETVGDEVNLYGFGGYFSQDAQGNDADEWSSFTIVTLNAATLDLIQVWWPGDGAYYHMSIEESFIDYLVAPVLMISPDDYQRLQTALRKQAVENMTPATSHASVKTQCPTIDGVEVHTPGSYIKSEWRQSERFDASVHCHYDVQWDYAICLRCGTPFSYETVEESYAVHRKEFVYNEDGSVKGFTCAECGYRSW